eukprot:m.307006 g.307006  ORF g.307006 m.307006 type:complete len:531 (+) comp19631_c0_seq1:43-1635(+)
MAEASSTPTISPSASASREELSALLSAMSSGGASTDVPGAFDELVYEADVTHLAAPPGVFGIALAEPTGAPAQLLLATRGSGSDALMTLHYEPREGASSAAIHPSRSKLVLSELPDDATVATVHAFSPVQAPQTVLLCVAYRSKEASNAFGLSAMGCFMNVYGVRAAAATFAGIANDCERYVLPGEPFACRDIQLEGDVNSTIVVCTTGGFVCVPTTPLAETDSSATPTVASSDSTELAAAPSGGDLAQPSLSEVSSSAKSPPSTLVESFLTQFPEAAAFDKLALVFDVKCTPAFSFLALGTYKGNVLIAVRRRGELLVQTSVKYDGPITSVRFFTHCASPPKESSSDTHLLVTCAAEAGVVYRNIVEDGLAFPELLPESGLSDSVLCSAVSDLSWTGFNSILLGTYGRQVLFYEAPAEIQARSTTVNSLSSCYKLRQAKKVNEPVFGVFCCDMTGDGLKEVIVVTALSVHVFQHHMDEALQRIELALTLLASGGDQADTFEGGSLDAPSQSSSPLRQRSDAVYTADSNQ